jgi:hypothetical protein
MPTKEELERLPLGWLAGLCKKISDADDASLPVAAREEAQKLYEEYLAIQVDQVENLEHAIGAARDHPIVDRQLWLHRLWLQSTRQDDNLKKRETDLKMRTIDFLWRIPTLPVDIKEQWLRLKS